MCKCRARRTLRLARVALLLEKYGFSLPRSLEPTRTTSSNPSLISARGTRSRFGPTYRTFIIAEHLLAVEPNRHFRSWMFFQLLSQNLQHGAQDCRGIVRAGQ